MSKSKKLFFIATAIFLLILIFIVIDFSRRTKFREFNKGKEGVSSNLIDVETIVDSDSLAQKLIMQDSILLNT